MSNPPVYAGGMKIKTIGKRMVNTAKVINRFGNAWLIRRANGRHELIGGRMATSPPPRNGLRCSPMTLFSIGGEPGTSVFLCNPARLNSRRCAAVIPTRSALYSLPDFYPVKPLACIGGVGINDRQRALKPSRINREIHSVKLVEY